MAPRTLRNPVDPDFAPFVPTAKEIRETRKTLSLTQARAAGMIGVSTLTWSQWETGRRSPAPAVWQMWLLCAGVTTLEEAQTMLDAEAAARSRRITGPRKTKPKAPPVD